MAVNKHYTNGAATKLWATAGSWDPSGVPAVDDNVFIGGRSSDDITGAVVAVTPARVTFRDYSGSFGEAGNPVIFEAAAPHSLNFLELKGSGKFFISTDADVTIVDAVIAITRRVASQCVIEGTYTNLYALMGSITISATVTNIYQSYLTNARANTTVIVSASATVANMRQQGGRSTISKTLTGDCFLSGGATMTYAVGNIDGFCYIHEGSRLIFNSNGGDIDEVEVFNRGVLDFTQSQDARSIGVTCIVHAGGLIDAQGVDELITITPTIKQIGAGAQVLPANLGTRLVLQPSVS